jgi:acyl-CoA dehydrogenase
MENELFKARLGLERLIEIGQNCEPGAETTNTAVMARTLVAASVICAVQKAVELVGGRSFHRSLGLERIYRDVLAAPFHPPSEKEQQQFSGRVALGVDLDAA